MWGGDRVKNPFYITLPHPMSIEKGWGRDIEKGWVTDRERGWGRDVEEGWRRKEGEGSWGHLIEGIVWLEVARL